MIPTPEQLDVFLGRADANSAHVYARLPLPPGEGWHLSARLRGPFVAGAHTLPGLFSLKPLAPGPTLLAAGNIPDPCYWTTEFPARYQLAAELRRGEEIHWSFIHSWGLLPFGVSGGWFRLGERRWQPRLVDRRSAPTAAPAEYRAAWADAWLAEPESTWLEAASELGVFVLGELNGRTPQTLQEVRRWSRHVCVGGLLLNPPPDELTPLRQAAPNMLFGAAAEFEAATKFDFHVLDLQDSLKLQPASTPLPQIARRRLAGPAEIAAARAACDALQRDLAPHGDFAAYVV